MITDDSISLIELKFLLQLEYLLYQGSTDQNRPYSVDGRCGRSGNPCPSVKSSSSAQTRLQIASIALDRHSPSDSVFINSIKLPIAMSVTSRRYFRDSDRMARTESRRSSNNVADSIRDDNFFTFQGFLLSYGPIGW